VLIKHLYSYFLIGTAVGLSGIFGSLTQAAVPLFCELKCTPAPVIAPKMVPLSSEKSTLTPSEKPPVSKAIPVNQHRVVINIPSRTLTVFNGDHSLANYPVGVGKPGYPTPLGNYQVIRKIKNPAWENPYLPKGKMVVPPGKLSPLGTRWIGFKEDKQGEYGIHGTDRPQSVGKFSSHGCVRMRIPDAEKVFDQVQIGTPVQVTYERVKLTQSKNQLYLTLYPDAFKRDTLTVGKLTQRVKAQFPSVLLDTGKLQGLLLNPPTTPVAIGTIPVAPVVNRMPQLPAGLQPEFLSEHFTVEDVK
jgi:lipoprotein-anchoring transpeptidase ErfK/SrfK